MEEKKLTGAFNPFTFIDLIIIMSRQILGKEILCYVKAKLESMNKVLQMIPIQVTVYHKGEYYNIFNHYKLYCIQHYSIQLHNCSDDFLVIC